MANFDYSFSRVLVNEGFYDNDPNDPGGETIWGISRNNFPTWEGWTIVDGAKKLPNFPVTLKQNSELQEKVKLFYRDNFWFTVKADEIGDDSIAFSIFDFAVNVGPGKAIMLAQRSLRIKEDGIIGPTTLKMLNRSNPRDFCEIFAYQKTKYYVSLVLQKPVKQKYLLGWIKRAVL